MRRAVLLALLAAPALLSVFPAAGALRVVPDHPVAGRAATLVLEGGGPATHVEILFTRELATPALAGLLDGPHIHAPKLGGNLLHVPGGDAPAVSATGPGGDLAFLAAPMRDGSGWIVPIAFPSPGAWTVTVRNTPFRVDVPGLPDFAATENARREVFIGLESPLRPAPPHTRFVFQIASRPVGGGAWEPVTDALVGASYGGNGTVRADLESPGRYAARLPTFEGSAAPILLVNVTSPAIGSVQTGFGIRPTLASLPMSPFRNGTVSATFLHPGPYLVLAHDAGRGFHASLPIEVMAGAQVAPAFPSALPLATNATWRVRWSDNTPVLDPGEVTITIEQSGSAVAAFPGTADGRGNVTARLAFPAAGEYQLRFRAPGLGLDRTFGVSADPSLRGTDDGNTTGVLPQGADVPWWRSIPAPAALAAAFAAFAALGRRRA